MRWWYHNVSIMLTTRPKRVSRIALQMGHFRHEDFRIWCLAATTTDLTLALYASREPRRFTDDVRWHYSPAVGRASSMDTRAPSFQNCFHNYIPYTSVITRDRIYMQMHICIGMSFLKSDENFPRFRSLLLK